MDISQIPKAFWYSISFSIVIIALTFSWAAYNSRGMTIEIANAKVAISGQLSDIDKINNQLQLQSEQLEKTKKSLEEKIKNLETRQAKSTPTKAVDLKLFLKEAKEATLIQAVPSDAFIKNTKAIQSLQKSILVREILE